MPKQKINRYPGVVPFDESQQSVFFGRDNDIDKLSRLIKREQQILLYAKSGLGKSSLVNAGVLPLLRKEMLPIKVRFGAYVAGKSPSIVQTLRDYLPKAQNNKQFFLSEKLQPAELPNSLWLDFKALQAENEQTFLLVLDQFEEIFSYPADQIADFKRQMSDLLQREVPLAVSNFIEQAQKQNPDFLSDEEEDFVWEKPKVKMLIVIREDRYSLMNRLTDYLPYCLDNRYNLAPLTQAQAREAIVKPAEKPQGEEFLTPSFAYQPEALLKILDFLTKGGHVETTQLQILCNRLESLRLQQITERDIPNFDDIFLQFYEESIAQIPDAAEQLRARRFVETELIKKGQRVSLDALACTDYVSESTLKTLIDKQHLLRTETNSRGSQIYELAHDSLISPVLQAKEKREAEEARAEEERRQAEALREAREKAEREAQERLKERKRQRTILVIISFALIVSLSLSAWAILAQQEALEQKEKAQKALIISYQAKAKELESVKAVLESDKNLTEAKKYQQQIDSLQKLIKELQ